MNCFLYPRTRYKSTTKNSVHRFGDERCLSSMLYLCSRCNRDLPSNTACAPNCASMRSSSLYLATRSVRFGAPVLICPALRATTRSAIVVSSVSPERCETMARYPASCASWMAAIVSDSVPI